MAALCGAPYRKKSAPACLQSESTKFLSKLTSKSFNPAGTHSLLVLASSSSPCSNPNVNSASVPAAASPPSILPPSSMVSACWSLPVTTRADAGGASLQDTTWMPARRVGEGKGSKGRGARGAGISALCPCQIHSCEHTLHCFVGYIASLSHFPCFRRGFSRG